jgi:hypothetical protein
MEYLYGDSTPFPLKANFLEFLRDAIDFCVLVLAADDRIREVKARGRAASDAAAVEKRRLEKFAAAMSRAIEGAEQGQPDSPTAQLSAKIAGAIAREHEMALGGVDQNLQVELDRIATTETEARAECREALERLLASHDLPDTTTVVRLTMRDAGAYEATMDAHAEPNLTYTFALNVPDASLWAAPVRLDRIYTHLEIRAPQLSGWISKEVKVRPQRIERFVITELSDDGKTLRIKLRPEPAAEAGFDVEVSPGEERVSMSRVGPAGDALAGDFEVDPEDTPVLLDLATKLRAGAQGLTRQTLVNAAVGAEDFEAVPVFAEFIQSFVRVIAPIVCEISERSLMPSELVLRRALGNDRREEVFVSKATLREKFASLAAERRALFAPLGLDSGIKPQASSRPSTAETPVRAELATAHPPHPPPRPATTVPGRPRT